MWLRVIACALVLLFWGLLLINQLSPLNQPFSMLLQLLGAAMLALNLLAVAFYHQLLNQQPHPWRQRLLVLLFGALQMPSEGRTADSLENV